MLWAVNPSDPQPLYEQIATVVRRAVAERTLRPGDRLPASKDLADALDVNLHTVLRAYQMLRDEGLIELRRGRGAVVIAADTGASQLTTRIDELVAYAEQRGISRSQLAHRISQGVHDE